MTERAPARMEDLTAARAIAGGFLTGLANLVPGISGGTLLLAVGIFQPVIGAIAELTTLRFRARSVLILACLGAGWMVAVFGLAGAIGGAVVEHRWIMYSLFIGLTLGGVPILWRQLGRLDGVAGTGAAAGIAVMAAVTFIRPPEAAADGGTPAPLLAVGGMVAAAAMIMPGISGAYLLLVLGQYVTILTAIDQLRGGAVARDWQQVTSALRVCVPVGVGVALGVVGVSHLLRFLLGKFERATLGLLLGLLVGAVLGLWPFREDVPQDGPAASAKIAGQAPDQWPPRLVMPLPLEAAGSLGMVAVGFAVSTLVGRAGREVQRNSSNSHAST
jgi:putative membrane protein